MINWKRKKLCGKRDCCFKQVLFYVTTVQRRTGVFKNFNDFKCLRQCVINLRGSVISVEV